MKDRHTTFYGGKISEIKNCGKTVMLQIDFNGAYEIPFETEPTKGEHDFNICEVCQNSRKEIIKRLTEKFNGKGQKQGFPFCCAYHSNLTDVKEFNRGSFVSTPKLVADKIIYTNQHITNNHENENYYKDITDYIEYTVESFGEMPNGCGEPLYLSDYFPCVTNLLKQNTEINAERKKGLLEFLEVYQKPSTKKKNTDLNILFQTYQKWLKVFPFDLTFIEGLKEQISSKLPFLEGQVEYNPYTKTSKGKILTQTQLIKFLFEQTNTLLALVDSHSLVEKGIITNTQKHLVDLFGQNHRTKQTTLLQSYYQTETLYITVIKRWLKNEVEYFKNLTSSGNQPTIVDKNVDKEPTKKELLIAELSKYGFFELPKVKPLLEQSKQSLIELISKNGLPYSIAMFEYLDFLRYLETEHFTTKYKLNIEVVKWFNSAKDGRAVKGNISSLNPNPTEKTKARYTAYKHKEKVENDYEQLK